MKSSKKQLDILCVVAHPDDLELMAGGTIAKWIHENNKVHVLTLSHGVWTAPDGSLMRDKAEALIEETAAADYLGYSIQNLEYPAMDLEHEDKLVVEVLKRIEKYNINTLICPWSGDIHHDHETVSRIALSASRRIPRVLMGQINYYLWDFFTPNIFVDISNHWEQKIEALKCYKSQWDRAGQDWLEFLDATSRYYGKMIGVERAEGFITKKFKIDI